MQDSTAASGGTLLATVTYVYDVAGNRLQESDWTTGSGTTTTKYAYDGDDVFADLTSANALQTRRLYNDEVDQVFARISSGGTAAWYLTDYEGSVVGMTDATGTPQATISYDGFGNVLANSNSSFTDRYLYTGEQFNSTSGLQFNQGRYYDPGLGRWTQPDPIGLAGGDTNLYRYAGNNPTNEVDPTGLASLAVGGGDGGGASGIMLTPYLSSAGGAVSGFTTVSLTSFQNDGKGSGTGGTPPPPPPPPPPPHLDGNGAGHGSDFVSTQGYGPSLVRLTSYYVGGGDSGGSQRPMIQADLHPGRRSGQRWVPAGNGGITGSWQRLFRLRPGSPIIDGGSGSYGSRSGGGGGGSGGSNGPPMIRTTVYYPHGGGGSGDAPNPYVTTHFDRRLWKWQWPRKQQSA